MRVAFVINRPAYYRLPIYRILASEFDMRFYFTDPDVGRWWTQDHGEADIGGLDAILAPSPRTLFRELRNGGWDCVVAALGGRTHLLATALGTRTMPLVLCVGLWEYPRSIPHRIGRPLARYMLRRADTIVSYGPHTSRWIEDEVGRTERVAPMRNPVDGSLFGRVVPDAVRQELRRSFALETEMTACFVGRLEPEKGLDVLLTALGRTPSVGLVIIGSGSQGERIRVLAEARGCGKRVHLAGWVEQANLPEYYGSCDVLVIPSVSTPIFREPWGLVVNEAMHGGLPVIASDAVGAAAGGLVTDNETGLVVPERDVAALAAALQRLAADEPLRSRLGREAKQRVASYTFEGAASAFTSAIDRAVAVRERFR